MTVPRPTAHSTISRDGELDALFNLAVAFVQANQDASCSGLQRHFRIGYSLALQLQKRLEDNGALVGVESLVEPAEVIIRVIEQADWPAQAIIKIIACDESGNQRVAATSMAMPKDAVKSITRLYDKTNNIAPTFPSLKAVLGKAGHLAWASAASSGSNAAAEASLRACVDLKTQGVDLSAVSNILVITSMTPECSFISVIKKVFETVRSQVHSDARMATAIIIDDDQTEQVEVQLLATGLPTSFAGSANSINNPT